MVPLMLTVASGLLLWVAFTVIGPYALQHSPGPQNPSFVWYMVYKAIPPVIFLTVFVLMFSAWSFWKHGRVQFPRRPLKQSVKRNL
jgi:hypothetical protein